MCGISTVYNVLLFVFLIYLTIVLYMQDIETESISVKKETSARGGTGSKRSRAAEVHNLSERVSNKTSEHITLKMFVVVPFYNIHLSSHFWHV